MVSPQEQAHLAAIVSDRLGLALAKVMLMTEWNLHPRRISAPHPKIITEAQAERGLPADYVDHVYFRPVVMQRDRPT